MKRLRLKNAALWVPLLVLLAVIALLVTERVRGKWALGRHRAALASQGAKLTPADMVKHYSTEEDGAPQLLSAVQELERGAVVPNSMPPVMDLLASGRAVAGFREPYWTLGRTTNDWVKVAGDLKSNAGPLAEARVALSKPHFDNHLDYAAGADMKFMHLAGIRLLALYLGTAAQSALHEGRPAAVVSNLEAQLRLPRSLQNDQLVISDLVRKSIAGLARSYTWEALQADGWSDADLSRLQAAWEQTSFMKVMCGSLEGERVLSTVTYEQMRASNETARTLLFGVEEMMGFEKDTDPDSLLPLLRATRAQVYCRLWRFAWLDQRELAYDKYLERLIETCREACSHKSRLKAIPSIEVATTAMTARNAYDRLRFTEELSVAPLARAVNMAMRAEAERSLVIAVIAIKRYALKHGNVPESLAALVPSFLPSVPIDWMDGQALRYRKTGGNSYLLYSIGEDGVDDGGDASLSGPKSQGTHWWARKDVVWPSVALEPELEKFRKEGK